jgi:16S rRNA (uracil1498-N3)-methyltransferase
MHRFHLPPERCASPLLVLKDREAHHAVHVLRVAHGDQVTVLDGAGQELLCNVAEATRQIVRLEVVGRKHMPPLPWQITLLQAIPKARLIEDIIQRTTELGVHRVVPLLSERVVSHLDAAGIAARAAKWRQTAVEAVKQCGNPWLPHIEAPLSPAAFVERRESFDLALIASLVDAPRHLREHLADFQNTHHRLPKTVCVWVGPEGDFTPAEVDLAKSAGALPISLGRLVLRCETAATYCLSILNYELGSPRA